MSSGSKKPLTARVPDDLHRRARICAIEEGRSVSALVEEAVRRYLADWPYSVRRSAP